MALRAAMMNESNEQLLARFRFGRPRSRTSGCFTRLSVKDLLYLILLSTISIPIAAITWRVDVGGAVYSSPVFSPSGALYVSSYDGHLYSIAANGSRAWRILLGPLYYSPLFVHGENMTDDQALSSPKVLVGFNVGGGGLGVVASVSTEGQLLSRDNFGVGSLQCAPQQLWATLLSCNDGGDIVALSGDGRGQMWSADIHGGSVLSNIVVFNNVFGGMLCVGGAAHRIACLDVNGSTIWNTTGGGSADDFVTVLASALGGSSLVSGAPCLSLQTISLPACSFVWHQQAEHVLFVLFVSSHPPSSNIPRPSYVTRQQ